MSILKKINDFLTSGERNKALILFIMLMISSFFDVAGVASIMPFMAVLVNPGVIETNAALAWLYSTLGFNNEQDFLFYLGVAVFVLLVFSICLKAALIYAQIKFIKFREASIGERLIERYLSQPYIWFLQRHSSDLGKNVLQEVAEVVNSSMLSLIMLCANGVVCLGIITLLLIVNTKIALTVAAVLIGFYLIFYNLGKYVSTREGHNRLRANAKRFLIVNEAFSSIKDIKVGSLENRFISRFSKYSKIYAKSYLNSQMIAQLPRYGMEAVAFGGLILMLISLISEDGSNLDKVIPIIALYAFSGYRLIPALQQVYSGVSLLRFSIPALESLHSDLVSLKTYDLGQESQMKIKFEHNIKLKNIHFSYPNASKLSLENLNIVIPAKSNIGLVGSTGCGKTTTVDLILGLLEPKKGELSVDGVVIDKNNLQKWQKNIGYVPQQIYLSDDTIASNIAYGFEKNTINQSDMVQAAKIANLDKFVVDELPDGYNTLIGERGVRLSGGQRQRIGIARALYLKPKLLILDEATSALDGSTELTVMDAINNLGGDITVIMIAHRLNTVRQCDQIYLLDKGRIKASGTYNEVIAGNDQFK